MAKSGTSTPDADIRLIIEKAKIHILENGEPNKKRISEETGFGRNKVRYVLEGLARPGGLQGYTFSAEPQGEIGDIVNAKLREELRETKRQLANNVKETIDEQAIKQILNVMGTASTQSPNWAVTRRPKSGAEHVPMTMWSDWHGGETINSAEVNGVNEYNSTILEKRVKTLVEQTIHLCDAYGPGNYPGMVINLVGDFISGELHPELAKSDELARIPSALFVRDLMVWALSKMADHFGKLFVPCVSGNHGRDTVRPEYKGINHHNFDWLIYQLLMREFEKDSRVTFMIPESNECLYRVYDRRFMLVHGDMIGSTGGDGIIGAIGPIMRGEFKTRVQSASIGRDYDILLMGHYHQELYLPQVRVSNALKGFDEYAKNKMRAKPSTPSQPLWFENPTNGSVGYHNVLVDKPIKEMEKAPWVSWKDAA